MNNNNLIHDGIQVRTNNNNKKNIIYLVLLHQYTVHLIEYELGIITPIISFIIELFARLYIFVCIYNYMPAIPGQTAGPNGLKFF